jgi:MTH538 TIR-like domain (DUF1863)
LEGNEPVSDNSWEVVKRGGDAAIKKWIENEKSNRSCVVVLVGSQTSNRPWVKYEIEKGWNDGKGVVGVRIHGLKNFAQQTSTAGPNPFDTFNIRGKPFSSIVALWDPPGFDSKSVYASIKNNLDSLVEKATLIRAQY